jgi:hypothetical protein
MRWLVIALVVMVVTALAFIPFETIIDDGLWPLSVTVRSTAGRPIKGISAEAFTSVEDARKLLADLPPLALTRWEKSIHSVVQEPKVDEPLKINIPTSETIHRSLLWTTHRRFFQYRGLLIVVEYEGGKLEGRAVEIPDLRQVRHVTVEVP